jgi:hypothetical protein
MSVKKHHAIKFMRLLEKPPSGGFFSLHGAVVLDNGMKRTIEIQWIQMQ